MAASSQSRRRHRQELRYPGEPLLPPTGRRPRGLRFQAWAALPLLQVQRAPRAQPGGAGVRAGRGVVPAGVERVPGRDLPGYHLLVAARRQFTGPMPQRLPHPHGPRLAAGAADVHLRRRSADPARVPHPPVLAHSSRSLTCRRSGSTTCATAPPPSRCVSWRGGVCRRFASAGTGGCCRETRESRPGGTLGWERWRRAARRARRLRASPARPGRTAAAASSCATPGRSVAG